MSVLRYIDNEVPWDGDYGEWDSRVQAGGSTIERAAAAAWPERGSYGLRVQTTAAGVAYLRKTGWCPAPAPGGWICLGLWLRCTAYPANYTYILQATFGGSTGLRLLLNLDGDLRLWYGNDGGGVWGTLGAASLPLNRWEYVAIAYQRATTDVAADGQAIIYQNGQVGEAIGSIDNYDLLAAAGDTLDAGCALTPRNDLVLDLDELKIVDAQYGEPFAPAPAGEYSSGRRTVVLWRKASTDSRDFADYCASALGVPRANLCPLPDASASESLASYAAFQAEVEDDLTAWLGRNPTIAGRCTTFLIGHGVPGYFTSGGVKHSAASRLMNHGTAFSSGTANPLYKPPTVARLTKALLAGKHLCCRIDADSLAHAEDVIDAAAVVAGLPALPDSDKLYCDDATYRASLDCQRLRILTAALGTFSNDAFAWGDTGSPAFGAAGSRACFADDSADSADTLRASSEIFDALITNGYASGLGSSAAAETFDAGSFFEMLRIGGTLAEAVAVAAAHLDYTAVPVGDPLMTVAFQPDGYNVYRGTGGIENVDFESPVACLRKDDTSPTLTGLGHWTSSSYLYVVRPVRGPNELETPDLSCRVEFETDASGQWVGRRPGGVDFVQASVLAGGKLRVRWGYTTPYGAEPPEDFAIYCSDDPRIAAGSPQATVAYTTDRLYSTDLTLTDGDTRWLAVTARSAGGAESHLSEVIGPFVARAAGPVAPRALAGSTFR